MSVSVHLGQRCLLCMISKVVPVLALGKVGRGCGLCCEESAFSLASDNLSCEGQTEPSEVASATQTTHHHVSLPADEVELFHRLQAATSLMIENMIQHP